MSSDTRRRNLNAGPEPARWGRALTLGLVVLGLLPFSLGALESQESSAANLVVDRTANATGLGVLDGSLLQNLAAAAGSERFYICASDVALPTIYRDARHVFFTFPTAEAMKRMNPDRQIVVGGQEGTTIIASGTPAEVLQAMLPASALGEATTSDFAQRVGESLRLFIYGGHARLLSANPGAPSEKAPGIIGKRGIEDDAELQSLARNPTVERRGAGSWIWTGRFVISTGAVEDVTLTYDGGAKPLLTRERKVVNSDSQFSAHPGLEETAEIWTVSKRSPWRAPKKYEALLAMAALGSTQAKHRLAVSLLGEREPSSRIEGEKWLRAAAADGCSDAALQLALLSEGGFRTDRSRENVRIHRCGALPGRSAR